MAADVLRFGVVEGAADQADPTHVIVALSS